MARFFQKKTSRQPAGSAPQPVLRQAPLKTKGTTKVTPSKKDVFAAEWGKTG
jgi:hypothetical protein